MRTPSGGPRWITALACSAATAACAGSAAPPTGLVLDIQDVAVREVSDFHRIEVVFTAKNYDSTALYLCPCEAKWLRYLIIQHDTSWYPLGGICLEGAPQHPPLASGAELIDTVSTGLRVGTFRVRARYGTEQADACSEVVESQEFVVRSPP